MVGEYPFPSAGLDYRNLFCGFFVPVLEQVTARGNGISALLVAIAHHLLRVCVGVAGKVGRGAPSLGVDYHLACCRIGDWRTCLLPWRNLVVGSVSPLHSVASLCGYHCSRWWTVAVPAYDWVRNRLPVWCKRGWDTSGLLGVYCRGGGYHTSPHERRRGGGSPSLLHLHPLPILWLGDNLPLANLDEEERGEMNDWGVVAQATTPFCLL